MSRRLRIGLVADNYPDLGGSGGIGTYTKTVAYSLAEMGHEVEVFAFGRTRTRERRRIGAISVTALPGWSRRREMPPEQAVRFTIAHRNQARRLNAFEVADAVAADVRRSGKFDVIEAPEFGGLGSLLRRSMARRRAIRLHGAAGLSFGDHAASHPWRGMADPERASVIAADSVSAPTSAILSASEGAWGITLRDVTVIPNPVDWVPPRPRGLERNLDLLYFGRLEYRKGIDVFCRAVAQLGGDLQIGAAGLDATLPSGRTGAELVQLSAPGRATIFGPLPHAELISLVRRAKIVVAPSRAEAFGLVVAESMMWGTPVIASDIDCFRELTRGGRDAVLFAGESAESLARCVGGLLADPERLQAIAEDSYQAAQRFRAEDVVLHLLESWGV